MNVDYQRIIKESEKELLELEKRHRYSHLMQRLKVLRLLKSGECSSLSQAAKTIDYSFRQCHRWLTDYRKGGLESLLENRVSQRGRKDWQNEAAWTALQKALAAGEIATYEQARVLLAKQGVVYQGVSGVARFFQRHKLKLKTGRPRYEKADPQQQVAFKKTLLSV